MSELTKEYFEGYLEAKFNEKLANVATKDDLTTKIDNLAQLTAKSFERLETTIGVMQSNIKELQGDLKIVQEDVQGLRVDVIQLGIGMDSLSTRVGRVESVLNIEKQVQSV